MVDQDLIPLPSSLPVDPDTDLLSCPHTSLRGTLTWAPPRPQIVLTVQARPGRRTRTRLEAAGRDRSLESESLSEPEAGVSLARIGLPLSYPDNLESCNCDRNNLLSDSDDKQSKFEIFFFKFLLLMFQARYIACLLLIILFCLLFLIFSDKRFYSLAFPPDHPETSGNSEIGMLDNYKFYEIFFFDFLLISSHCGRV